MDFGTCHRDDRLFRQAGESPADWYSTLKKTCVLIVAIALVATTVMRAQTGPAPSVTPYGIVNSTTLHSSFSPIAAPGSLVTIFGENLSSATISAATLPLPTQ